MTFFLTPFAIFFGRCFSFGPMSFFGPSSSKKVISHFLFLLCASFIFSLAPKPCKAYEPLAISGPVTDPDGLLSAADREQIAEKLVKYKNKLGVEMAVLALFSLQGQEPDDVAHATFRAWGLGDKNRDDGVLILWAKKERKIRIEVGKGLEGELTDLQANDIIRTKIAPQFKRENYALGLLLGIDSVASELSRFRNEDKAKTSGPTGVGAGPTRSGLSGLTFLVGLLILFVPIWIILWLVRKGQNVGRDGYVGRHPLDPLNPNSPSDRWDDDERRWGGFYGGPRFGPHDSSGWDSQDSGSANDTDWGGGGGDSGGGGSSGDY